MNLSLKTSRSRQMARFYAALLSGPLGFTALHAADIIKADNAAALNDSASWVGGVVPSAGDVAVFDSSSPSASFVSVGGNLAFKGIRVQGNPASLVIGGASTTEFLTLGTSGFDLSGATSGTVVDIDSPTVRLAPGSSAYWKVGAGVSSTLWGPLAGLTAGSFPNGGFTLDTRGTNTGSLFAEGFGAPSTFLPYATVLTDTGINFATLNAGDRKIISADALGIPNPSDGGVATTAAALSGFPTTASGNYIDVTVSNGMATSTAFAINATRFPESIGAGIRFNQPHATAGTNWTVSFGNSGRIQSNYPVSILVTPGVGARDVIFSNGGGTHEFRFNNANGQLCFQQFNTAGTLYWRGDLSSAAATGTTGAASIMKSGPGKLVFANAGFSAPAGTVVGIAEGVMQLGENNATGNLSYTNASNVLVALNVVNNGTLRFQRSDSVNFTNLISGDGNLEVAMTPGGNLVLSGANTYAGSTKLESGTLTLGSASALGASALIDFAGASLVYGSGITTDISSSPITLSANATVNTNGNDVTWANSVGGSGALFKTGAGSLTLGGASTYAGGTTVSTGELIVANTSGSATGTGGITLSSGGSLRGTGIVSGTVTTVSGSTVAPGLNGVGTLTLGGLSLASGTILDLEFASTSSHDKVVTTLSGGLTLNGGGLRLFSPGSVTPYSGVGTYSLLGFAGSVQGVGPSSLSVLNPQAGYSYTFGSSGGFVTLQIIQDAILSQWTATGGGSWGSAGSWSNGVPSSDYTAQFTTSLAAPATVTLDGNRTVNGIVFDSPQGYTVASGTSGSLTLQKTGGAAANVLSGTHTISAPVVLASSLGVSTASGSSLTLSGVVSGTGGLVKDGAGLLSLTGHNTFSGSINAVSGVLGFSFADSLGSGALTLNGATLLFNADNAADVSAKSITFGLNGGAIDTNNNDVVFAGSIGNAGEGFFSKTGEGSLTLQADSTYLGQTFVKGGELIIAGNGSLGPVASAQALNLDGGVVAPLSTMTLDNAGANARPVVVGSAGGGFLVSSGLTLTVPGLISGTGQLSKSGEGDLSILGNNSAYTGGVLIEGGSVRLGTDRATLQTGIGTGTIKFGNSSALYLNGVGIPDNNNTFGTLSNAVVVPLGATAEIRTPSRGGYNGVASGQAVTVTNPDNSTSTVYQTGTLNLYIDGTRFDMSGVWPNFTGTLSIRKTPTGDGTDTDDYRLAAAHNMVAARVHVNSGVKVYQTFNPPSGTGTSTIHNFGELTADQGAILEGNPVGGRYNTYSVGALNTDFAISGQFRGSLGIFGYGYPSLTKVGTGTLTLNNAHMMASPVTVNGGTLKVTGAIERFYTGIGADGAYGRFPVDTGTCDDTISLTPPATDYQNTEPGALTVAAAGTLGGNGALGGAITVNGTLRPDSTGDLGGNLDLTGAASLTLAATATTQFDFKGANFTGVKSTATGAITFNGLLKFNFLGTVFDGSYKVFDLAVAPTGAFTGVSVTTTTATETALGNSGTVWSGTVGAQSYSFDASTGILTVTGGGTAVTPGASVLSGTAGNAKVDLSWTSASGADTYTVQRSTTQGGPYTNVISALAGTTYSDTTVTNGTTYYYVVQAKNSSSNLSGANSNEVSATPVAGPAHTALQTWRFDQFGVYDDDSSVLAGDTEDFDGDGLANLLEYALGTNPTVPNASPITVAKSGNFLTLTYPLRSPADTALTYTVQGSNDLTGGFTTGAGTTNTVGSTSTYTDNVSVSTAGARRFLRLSVSYTSP